MPVGQSFATPSLKRNGKQDHYQVAGDYTTSAQAEGAIVGKASDYEAQSAHATEFLYSRFDAPKIEPASADAARSTTDVLDASSVERVAEPPAELDRRRLAEHTST